MDPQIVDEEDLVGEFLRSQTDVVALLADPVEGVSSNLNGKFPAIRLTRVSGGPAHPWEDSPVVQVECWADTRAGAKDLMRVTLAALGDIVGGYPQGRVAGHEITSSIFHVQDEDTKRHKYQFDVRLLTYSADEFDSRD